jgi:triacylglycerol lipase
MVSLTLRITLAVLALALVAQWRAAHPLAAMLAVVGIFLALHSAVVAASFAISRRHRWKTPPELAEGRRVTVSMVLREWLAYLLLFIVIQPFERFWLGKDAATRVAPGGVPVLCVHGYMCNRGIWWWMRRKLAARGLTVATLTLEPPHGGIADFAAQLHRRIEAVCAETGAAQVALVAHSMGGLVARAYLRDHGAARVVRLVTIATPHHGTSVAHFGIGRDAREMEPGSALLRSLAAQPPAVPTLSIWSPADNFVAPQDSSRLAGARERIVPAHGHMSLLLSPTVLAIVLHELEHSHDPHR